MRNISYVLLVSAVLGYVVSYKSFYLFHLVALIWLMLAVVLSFRSIPVNSYKLLAPFGVFFLYSLLSVLWNESFEIWLKYQFYFICGFIVISVVFTLVDSSKNATLFLKVLACLYGVNMMIGMFESLDVFRLPMSKLSADAGYFGVSSVYDSGKSVETIEAERTMPTGFYYNPNNFGFILMLISPFVLFGANSFIKIPLLALIAWLIYSIGSKGIFLSFVFMCLVLPMYFKGMFSKAMGLFVCLGVIGLGVAVVDIYSLENRMFMVVDEIMSGVDGNFEAGREDSSTANRSKIYLTGIKGLIDSYGLGLGLGGGEFLVGASFHFFFLQMLVDMGVFPFVLFLLAYFYLIYRLYFIGRKCAGTLGYLGRATSLALLVAVPASISPSGVHYTLSYYILLGLGLSVLNIYKMEKQWLNK